MDDKLNILSIKVPFQFKVASIIATDQVEILGTTIKVGPPKDVYYDILSRVVHDNKFKPFKALGVRSSYFKEEDNNILIPKVGLMFDEAGTYIIESNFNIKLKRNRPVNLIFLNYKHNKIIYESYVNSVKSLEVKFSSYIRFDVKRNDTLVIKLSAVNINYEDIFESFTNSSIEILC